MRRDQALWDSDGRPPHATGPQGDRISSKRDSKNEPWIPNVFRAFAKTFNAKPITLEQEKRIKTMLNRAVDEDAAWDVIDLLFQEGMTYANGRQVREAVERVNLRRSLAVAPEPWTGELVTFRDWYAAQDAAMQERVRRVFPSLDVEKWSA